MRREYVTIKNAAATTTTMAINGGLKSTGSFEGGGDDDDDDEDDVDDDEDGGGDDEGEEEGVGDGDGAQVVNPMTGDGSDFVRVVVVGLLFLESGVRSLEREGGLRGLMSEELTVLFCLVSPNDLSMQDGGYTTRRHW